jgi:hypothetical protein
MTAEVKPQIWLKETGSWIRSHPPLACHKKKIGQFGRDKGRRDELTRWMKWRMFGISGYIVGAAQQGRVLNSAACLQQVDPQTVNRGGRDDGSTAIERL